MNNKFITERIKYVQKRLNALISLASLGRMITLLGGLTGIVLVIACWTGVMMPWNAWRLWTIVVTIGVFLGYLWSRTKHLDLYDTARWLDGKFKDHEGLSAALVCMKHQTAEAFDQIILERAVQLLKDQSRIKWPFRQMLSWLGSAVLAITVFSMGFCLWPKDLQPVRFQSNQALIKNIPHAYSRKRANEDDTKQSPKKMAERLFPHNPKMARRMAKALEKGDAAELEKLLKDAKWDTDFMSNRETASAEKPQAQAEKEAMQQKMLEMAKGMSFDGKDKRKGKKSGTPTSNQRIAGDKNGDSRERQQSTDTRKGNGSRFTPGTRKEKVEGERRSQMANAGLGKKGQAGKGNSSAGKRWGNLDGGSGSQTALITSKKNSPMLEYVMPNKGAQMPLSQTAPLAGRAAESAMAKENLPGEYESFVRSYFLRLTKAAGGGKHGKK